MPGREIQERIHPRTAGTGTGRTGRAAYRYRGAPKPDPATARAQQALATLAQLRTTIALRSSRVRALNAELGDYVAQALCDGVKVAALAQAAGLPAASIRSAAAARGGAVSVRAKAGAVIFTSLQGWLRSWQRPKAPGVP